jgi:CheY-like chemotaxis protein
MRSMPRPDAPTALTLAREQVPDLVLASVMTRVLDGFDLCASFAEIRVGKFLSFFTRPAPMRSRVWKAWKPERTTT